MLPQAFKIVTAPTKIVDANPNRMGLYLIHTSFGGSQGFIGPTSAVGTTAATGMPLYLDDYFWLPTSAEVWANSPGCQVHYIEVLYS
jgi:hypothetical protein